MNSHNAEVTKMNSTTDCKRIAPQDRTVHTSTCKNCGRKVESMFTTRRGFIYIHSN